MMEWTLEAGYDGGRRAKNPLAAAGGATRRSTLASTLAAGTTKELEMNLKTVNALLAETEDGLMGGLAASDVFSKSSGMSVAGIRSSPKACALFNILCERIGETIKKSGLPVPDYLQQTMLRLGEDGNVMIVVIDLDAKYRWGMAVDCTKAQLGILVSVVIPDTLPRLREALR